MTFLEISPGETPGLFFHKNGHPGIPFHQEDIDEPISGGAHRVSHLSAIAFGCQ